ncbi:MAG: hypothetical protein GF350_01055 [Chitinivibrionales bacterium]|nr:hypothetical protein [Chitinivibrionales bacterium]
MNCSIRAVVLISLVAFPCTAARFALLAGNSDAGSGYNRLRYVLNDLEELRSILTENCGFDKKNISMLYNSSPEELLQAFSALEKKRDNPSGEDLFLFYYSGHSLKDSLLMGNGRLPMKTLKERLDRSTGSIRIVILDACQSGGFTRTKGGTLAEPFLFREDGKVTGQVVLYSSSANENSQESDYYRNSVFTFHFCNALRGCGDISQDGKVTLNEAYQYSYNHTIASTARSAAGMQHPGYQFKIQGEGDIVLADLNMHSQGIVLEQGVAGALTITNRNRAIVADLSKEADSRFLIALKPGTYKIINESGGEKRLATTTIKNGTVHSIYPAQFRHIRPENATLKGAVHHRCIFSIIGSFGYHFFDFDPLARRLEAAFSGYALFGMTPAFNFPAGLYRPELTAEIQFPHGIVGRLGAAYLWDSGRNTYRSSAINQTDSTRYSCSLNIRTDLDIRAIHTGPGIRFAKGLLRGFSFHAGARFMIIQMRCTSAFSNALFNTEHTGKQKENGILVLPAVSIEYEYPLSSMTHIGASIRYNYQVSPAEIDQKSDFSFSYDFGGFDMALTVRIPFKQNNGEKRQ